MTRSPLAPILVAALMVALMLAGATAPVLAGGERAVTFLAGIEDLPLMAGMEEVAEGGMVFDSPAGRVVEAYASGPTDRAAILEFYGDTLPQLGWRRTGADTFVREGEVLRLEFPENGTAGRTTVRFALSPQGTDTNR